MPNPELTALLLPMTDMAPDPTAPLKSALLEAAFKANQLYKSL